MTRRWLRSPSWSEPTASRLDRAHPSYACPPGHPRRVAASRCAPGLTTMTAMSRSPGVVGGAWKFVVPFKDSRSAKSRLGFSQPLRRNLALSMLHDTVRGLLDVDDVERVFVVCGREADAFELHTWPRVETVIEDGPGLNEAIRLGEITARTSGPTAHLAVCPADLPALHPGELARVLTTCAAHARCVVADRDGSGTTLLTASPPSALRPEFGPGSFLAHLRSGAVVVDLPQHSSVRHDVDYVTDLDGLQQRAPRSRTAQLLRLRAPSDHGQQFVPKPTRT